MMEKIGALLFDPAWWFSSVIIAFLASLASNYWKDWFANLRAKRSERYAARRAAEERQDSERIQFLSGHPDLLMIEFVRYAVGEIIHLGCFGVGLVLPPVISSLASVFQLGVEHEPTKMILRNSAIFLAAIVQCAMVFCIYYVGSRVQRMRRIVNQAQSICEQKRRAQ